MLLAPSRNGIAVEVEVVIEEMEVVPLLVRHLSDYGIIHFFGTFKVIGTCDRNGIKLSNIVFILRVVVLLEISEEVQ
jgi:hypothetical protein